MFVVAIAVIFLSFKIPEFGFSRVTEVVWERSLHPCQGPKDMLYIWTAYNLPHHQGSSCRYHNFYFFCCVGPYIFVIAYDLLNLETSL